MAKEGMDGFTSKVLNFIQKNALLHGGDTVVTGFSGGADSTALLSVLWECKEILDIRVIAVHVNHGIREEAGLDEKFCEDFCKDRGIPFVVRFMDIPSMAKKEKLTEEEAGRLARYRIFNEILTAEGGGLVAVAHHQNDVAETVLMNLSRGSGLKGGSSIRPKRDNIIRPFLCTSRSEIEDYLREKDISFCTDRTNLENDHTRNYVRNAVIPMLQENVNNRAVEHLARAAGAFERAEEFIESYTVKLFEKEAVCNEKSVTFDVTRIAGEADIIKESFILLCFEKLVKNRKDIGAAHVDSVLELMKSTDGTSYASLPYGLKAVRSYRELTIGEKGNCKAKALEIFFEIEEGKETYVDVPGLGRAQIALLPYDNTKEPPTETYTKWLDYDRIQEVSFRQRKSGDHIFIEPDGKLRKKDLGKFFTDEKVPVSDRENMYLLADKDSILWIPGYRIGAAVKVSKDTRRILSIKITNGGNANG